MAEDPEIHEQLPEDHLRRRLATVVRKIQWSYAIFWSISARQPGILVWSDGYYNGDIKTRKTTQGIELKADLIGLQRSKQLRELYESLSAGDGSQQTRRPSASLSPEDLTDAEWYYLVCMSFTFTLGQGLPGKAFVNNQYVWLSNAQFAESKIFSRSLLAKSASIQTVVCIPIMGGVLELGTTDLVLEDSAMATQFTSFFWELPVPVCSEQSMSNTEMTDDDQVLLCPDLGNEISNSLVLEDQNFVTEGQIPLENAPAHYPFALHPYAPNEHTKLVQHKAETLHPKICKELNIDSPLDSSNECYRSHQLEDLFDMDGLSCMPQPQNKQFLGDEFRNGFHGALNSNDYASMPFTNAQRVVSSTSYARLRSQMLDSGSQMLDSGSQSKILSLEIDGVDSHYANTVATILCKSEQVKPVSSSFLKESQTSDFVVWRRGLNIQKPFMGASQNLLKKILIEGEWLRNGGRLPFPREKIGMQVKTWKHGEAGASHVLSERRRREKLNEKFVLLQSLIPSIGKVDKASILGDTIEYLKDLERRVEELETCRDSSELDTRERKRHPDVAERTSDNYGDRLITDGRKPLTNKRKASDITEAEATHHWILSKEGPVDVNVTMKEKEVSVEMHCPWRECLLLEIVESISNFHLDPLQMQSSIADGMLALTIKSKFRSTTVASPGMIKRSLQRVIGKCMR